MRDQSQPICDHMYVQASELQNLESFSTRWMASQLIYSEEDIDGPPKEQLMIN